jgi:hypothetical protein
LVAALFAPFAYLPSACGVVLWQLLNAVALLGGLAALLQTIFPTVRRYAGVVYLLIIPFALGNLDIGHSNPLLIGLLMLAVAAARVRRVRNLFKDLSSRPRTVDLRHCPAAIWLALVGCSSFGSRCSLPFSALVLCIRSISRLDLDA